MPDDPSATLSAIRERVEAATPGEWKHRTAEGRGDWSAGSKVFSIERVEADARPGGIGVIDAWADAEFIAMARTAVPSLVAALEAVLALHHRRETPVRTHHICRRHAPWALDTGYAEDCPDCTITEKWVCAHKQCRAECPDDDEWECPTYRAIISALTGQEAVK